jgi:hypothetical protein
MNKTHPAEKWAKVKFDAQFIDAGSIEVSNFGRIRTFNKISDGNIINGSMINGYRIIRLKRFLPREEAAQKKLDYMQRQVVKLAAKLRSQRENQEGKTAIAATDLLLKSIKENLSQKYKDDVRKRTVHMHFLVHRLVAEYFLPKPTAQQTVVAHLDYDKLNNKANNLKWMARGENILHQQSSPYVIKEKKERRHKKEDAKTAKLTVIKVMLLKKLLIQGKPIKQLVKQFKVTDTQIFRIKRGENWGDVKPAK